MLLIDADAAGDVVGWEKRARAASGVVLPFRVVSAASGAELYELASAASGYDHIVIDTPVRTDTPVRQDHEQSDDLLHAAAAVCDLVVLPTALSGLDLHGGAHTVELLAAQQTRTPSSETLQGRVLLNKISEPITPRALAMVRKHLAGWPVLGAALVAAPHYPAAYGSLPHRLDAVAAVGNVLLNEVDALTRRTTPTRRGSPWRTCSRCPDTRRSCSSPPCTTRRLHAARTTAPARAALPDPTLTAATEMKSTRSLKPSRAR